MCGLRGRHWLIWLAVKCFYCIVTYSNPPERQKHPGGSVTGVRKWWKWLFRHSEERFFSFKTSPKKRSIYFVNNNPSMTSAWKRAPATFSHIFFNASAVASIRFFPVHPHRHWKERMHFHIWGLRAWPFFDGKFPGMVCLRTFQKPSTWPVWILTFPCSSGFFLQCTHLLLLT